MVLPENKISKGLGIIYKARRLLNENTLKTLYYSFIYPYLHYCIIAWGNTYISYLDGLFKIQKRVIRMITFSSWTSHTYPLFQRLKLLTLSELYVFNVAIFMYKYHYGNVSAFIKMMFTLNINVHSYGTRQLMELHLPLPKTDLFKRSVGFQGAKIWNKVLKQIDINCSLCTFKYRIKQCIHNLII